MSNDTEIVRKEPQGRRGGEWVTLGLDEYRVPPLGFRDLQDLAGDIQALSRIGGHPTLEQMRGVARIAHAAIKRNYPAVTEDEVLDALDLGNYQAVLGAVLKIAGFEQAKPGEPAGLGEAAASSGAASTQP